jgi:hypothetical protein
VLFNDWAGHPGAEVLLVDVVADGQVTTFVEYIVKSHGQPCIFFSLAFLCFEIMEVFSEIRAVMVSIQHLIGLFQLIPSHHMRLNIS